MLSSGPIEVDEWTVTTVPKPPGYLPRQSASTKRYIGK